MLRPPTHLTLVPASAPRSKEDREADSHRQTAHPAGMERGSQLMEDVFDQSQPPADVFVATTISKLVPRDADTITVKLGDYLQDLGGDLAEVSGGPVYPKLTWSATEVELPTNVAITFVRVADLLITKSFVHAFPPDENGHIYVSFTVNADAWRLTISDNGIPIRSLVDRRCDGVAIARLLVLRHSGWLEMSGMTGGSRCIVTIPKSDPKGTADVEVQSILGSPKASDWHRHEL